jgi:histidinol-phosphate phosphatase family protein
MAYRRATLAEVGGFDERFPRAYREDADLALRVCRAGYRVVDGHRRTVHPIRVDPWFASLRAQAGNADDALMRRRHGRRWRELIGEGHGRIALHALTTAAGVLGLAALAPAGSRLRSFGVGAVAMWAAATTEFTVARLLRGPAVPAEIARIGVTSVLIPPLASAYRVLGARRARRSVREPAAVLFDRDDTVIVDVPYLSDASLVRPVIGAASALRRLRSAGVPVGIVSNQSGVAIGLITPEQLGEVNARVAQLLGPFDTVQVCPHADRDGCSCRKPAPGLIRRAAAELGVDVRRCVVIGDTGADVGAAVAAGAFAVLVPTRRTRPAEVELARRTAMVAPDIESAVDLAMGAMR